MKAFTFLFVLVITVQAREVTGLSVRPINICPIPFCVAPDPLNPQPTCTNQCKGDSDCGPNGKCCPMCGCNSCIGGIRPPQPPADSCKTRTCPPGQECVEEQVFCFRAPCPSYTRCVPIRNKPGSCPPFGCPIPLNPTCRRRQCRSDADCRGDRKCCTDCSGCRTCLEPFVLAPRPALSCASVTCAQGQVCVEEPTPHCEKPGQCPAPSGLVGICMITSDNCFSDAECSGALKCCSEGCGKVCKVPTS